MQTLRQLVCGTDFSPCSEHAFEQALKLATAAGARITLVHVCDLGADDDDEQSSTTSRPRSAQA
jgi:nucleotide-binding universal stress UspA family protein